MWHIIFFVLVGIWLAMDFYLVIFHNHHQKTTLEEKFSKYWLVFFICAGMLSVILWNEPAKAAWMEPFSWFRFLGLGFLLSGILIRLVAVIQLGDFFHSNVRTIKNHALVTKGMYSLVRHPSYTGLLFNFIGVALVFAYPLSSVTAFVLPLVGLFFRIHVEEKALLGKFPIEYRAYQKRTRRLIPWIF